MSGKCWHIHSRAPLLVYIALHLPIKMKFMYDLKKSVRTWALLIVCIQYIECSFLYSNSSVDGSQNHGLLRSPLWPWPAWLDFDLYFIQDLYFVIKWSGVLFEFRSLSIEIGISTFRNLFFRGWKYWYVINTPLLMLNLKAEQNNIIVDFLVEDAFYKKRRINE